MSRKKEFLMRQPVYIQSVVLMVILLMSGCIQDQKLSDPLPSWNEGAARTSIVEFVQAVTDETGPDFVPVPERIAVFDNDGTLWSEKPVYFQLIFAIDRVKELAAGHPEWKTTQPFQAVLENHRSVEVFQPQPAFEIRKLLLRIS